MDETFASPTQEPSNQARDAARRGDRAALDRLLELHSAADVRAEDDPLELTSLHLAAASGNEEIVDFLLSEAISSDPTAARVNNFTPLHAAAMHGWARVCTRLLEAGADPDVQTEPQGYAPLHSAAWGGHVEVIRVLLESGAQRDLRNHRGETPIETARRQGQDAAAGVLEAEGPGASGAGP